jgi:hypothetical protein
MSDSVRAETPANSRTLATAWLAVVLAAIFLVSATAKLPMYMKFAWFAVGDSGDNLTAQVLIDRGERPAVDFGYHYGLLALWIGRLWTGLFGRTPWGYQSMVIACNLTITWGLARCVQALRTGPAGLALLLVALPYMLEPGRSCFSHALEPVFLIFAIAAHAANRRGHALALLTACCFIKPSMGYVYGLFLLIFTVRALMRERAAPREFARQLGPAVVTAAALFAVLAAVYGPEAVVRTVLPISGAEAYKIYHFGFFRGIGRDFWAPRGARFTYYLVTIVGPWMIATFALLVAGLRALGPLLRGPVDDDEPRREVVAVCVLVHVAFVCLAFGNAWSWHYYFYVLIIGNMAAWGRRGVRSSVVAWALAVCMLPSYMSLAANVYHAWNDRTSSPSAEMAGLWATNAERSEWSEVLRIGWGQEPVLLAQQGGCAEMLYPEFAEPIGYLFNRGIALPGEVKRKAKQVADARVVVLENIIMPHRVFLGYWPEFRKALEGCELAFEGKFFVVYRRVAPASSIDPSRREQ